MNKGDLIKYYPEFMDVVKDIPDSFDYDIGEQEDSCFLQIRLVLRTTLSLSDPEIYKVYNMIGLNSYGLQVAKDIVASVKHKLALIEGVLNASHS